MGTKPVKMLASRFPTMREMRKSAIRMLGLGSGGAPSPALAGAAKGDVTAAEIRDKKQEIVDRDREILWREERIEDFNSDVREVVDQLEKDKEDRKRDIPETEAEKTVEVERLKKTIKDRAEQLDDLLDRERDWVDAQMEKKKRKGKKSHTPAELV